MNPDFKQCRHDFLVAWPILLERNVTAQEAAQVKAPYWGERS